MARFNYSTYLKKEEKKDKGDYKVSYFGLKDDGDEAIVRFVYNSTEEFHLATVHAIEVDGKQRRVSCLRTGTEPLSKCPLCEAGHRVFDKMYVKLVQYTTDSNGQVLVQGKVWERPAHFSKKIETLFREYGNVSDVVFKVVRRGKKGDTKTDYDILFANPVIYKAEIYTKDFSAFDGFEINKFFYTEKTTEEMSTFVQTGKFPERVKTPTDTLASSVQTTSSTAQQSDVYHTTIGAPVQTVETVPSVQPSTPTTSDPTTNTDPTTNRPRRYTY